MVFEVKAKHHTTPQWAAEFRRNLLRREEFRPTQYFSIVTPDQLYLWREPKPETEVVLPDFVVDSRPLFLPYLQKTSVDLDRISPFVFEMLVISWLSDLVYARQGTEGLEPGQAGSWIRVSWMQPGTAGSSTTTPLERLRRVQLRSRACSGPGAARLLREDSDPLRGR